MTNGRWPQFSSSAPRNDRWCSTFTLFIWQSSLQMTPKKMNPFKKCILFFTNVLSLCKSSVFLLASPSNEIFLSSRVIAHLLPTFLCCSVWVSLEDKPFQKKRVNDPSDFKANCLFIIYLKYANLPWLREFSIVCISLWSDHTSDTNRGRNWLNPSLWRKEFLLTLWCYYCFFICIRLDSRSNAKRRKYV